MEVLLGFVFCLTLGVLFWAFQKKSEETKKSLSESFKALSFEIMERNSQIFLDLAKSSLDKQQESVRQDLDSRHKTIQETLKQLDFSQRELEKKREGAYFALTKQLEEMQKSERELRAETAKLSSALRSPQIRGSWGEIHLRRVIEIAGLLNHCDFFEQKSLTSEGKIWRPDVVVRLPRSRYIAIDAKTPISSYLEASETQEESFRKQKLQEHAQGLRRHIKELSSKEYWRQLETTPEYVILFLPAEAFYSAALETDPKLIEEGADKNIIIATPTTLIAILRAVAFTWTQESLSERAKEIAELGSELYFRLGTVCEHWNKVGRNLNTSIDAYNQSIASMQSRVLVTARKLKEMGSLSSEISEPLAIEKIAKVNSSKE